MGNKLTTQIEIAASPAEVRDKLLDFPSLPRYHNSFFTSITTNPPSSPLIPGTKVHGVMQFGTITPTILTNSPSEFKWRGSLPGFNVPVLFSGDHGFKFLEREGSGGGTTFVHEEEFSGLLAWVVGEGMLARWIGLRRKIERGFEGYNGDLKRWCEKGKIA